MLSIGACGVATAQCLTIQSEACHVGLRAWACFTPFIDLHLINRDIGIAKIECLWTYLLKTFQGAQIQPFQLSQT